MDPLASTCRLYRMGMAAYEPAWRFQEKLAAEVAGGESPAFILLEHPPTFTLGRSAKAGHLLWDEAELARRGALVYQVDRGGDITYHGPGQLVGYPILRLAPVGWQGQRLPQADFVGHIRRLEEMIILALSRLGLPAQARPGLSGVWISAEDTAGCLHPMKRTELSPNLPGKIASIGVKVDVNGISRHGFALNVAPEMGYWEGIIPCGLDGVQMVSLADFFDPAPTMDQVRDVIEKAFSEIFGLILLPVGNLPNLN